VNGPPLRLLLLAIVLIAGALMVTASGCGGGWSDEELDAMRALWIGNLAPVPADPTNAYAEDERAAELGHKLFFDPRFSLNGEVSCATCHKPDQQFQDGLPLAKGLGTFNRRTQTIIASAYGSWYFWDGRKDSLWAQATGPVENAVEHGVDRTFVAHVIDRYYREEYEAIFGPLPDLTGLPERAGPVDDTEARQAWQALSAEEQEAVSRVLANFGKTIAAYERKIGFGPSRFDDYAEAVLAGDNAAEGILSEDEEAGLRLFLGRAQCTNCHNGPLLTNHDFHNTGIPIVPGLPPDTGRYAGVEQVLEDEFNCLGPFNDSPLDQCEELRFVLVEDIRTVARYRTPSLRNVAERSPYMHAGQFQSLAEVVDHYSRAPDAAIGHQELNPLDLSEQEQGQLVAFLGALTGPIDAAPEWLRPPSDAP
jgi:cytochrome c peroxidase